MKPSILLTLIYLLLLKQGEVLALILIGISFINWTATSAVQIINGPQNITVREGNSATFNCTISRTTEVPYWYIDGTIYTRDDLPPRHSYLNQVLTVNNVSILDNGTTYQCGVIPSPVSAIATLTVVLEAIIDCILCSIHFIYRC